MSDKPHIIVFNPDQSAVFFFADHGDFTGDDGPFHGKATMCRTKTHKCVRRLYEEDELYDLAADPGETCNRIADPACAGVLAELRERLLEWYQETCDVVPRECDRR